MQEITAYKKACLDGFVGSAVEFDQFLQNAEPISGSREQPARLKIAQDIPFELSAWPHIQPRMCKTSNTVFDS